MKLTIKKTFVVLTTMCMLAAVPQESYGQSWLKKITKGIDKGFDAVNKGLDNVSKAIGGSSTTNNSTNENTNGGAQQNGVPAQTQATNGSFPVTLAGSTNDGAKNPNVTMVMQSCQRNGNDVHVTYLATNRNAKDIRVSILASSLDERWTIAYDANGKKHRTDFVYNDNKFNTNISGFVDITLLHGITSPILMIIKDVDASIKKMARVSIAFNHYMYSLDNVPITEQPAAAVQQSFILKNGTLGPVKKGMAVGSLPKQYSGLYDKITRDKEYYNDEDFDEYLLFTKNGKEIFRTFLDGNKIASICLLSGSSSFIKTSEGIYVGYPAQKLNKEKKLKWEYNMDSVVAWATSGEYTYNVENGDLITDDMNETIVRGFKTGAKICEIQH